MKRISKLLLLAAVFTFSSCGGGDEKKPSMFFKPRWVDGASNAVMIKNSLTKVVYVSNYLAGTVIPIDSERRKAVDTDLFTDTLTPVAIDRALGQVIVKTSQTDGFAFDIFVISEGTNSLYLIRAAESGSDTEIYLEHSFVDIGSVLQCTHSEPFFEERGNASNPALSEIVLSEGTTKTENWLVKYSSNDNAYTVEGSLSGLQNNMAVEDKTYTSDDGGLSFNIYSGSKKTTNKDNFTFGTTCVKPLGLSGIPKTFIIDSGKIFIGIYDGAKLSVYNESDFSFIQNINLNAGFTPASIAKVGDFLYAADESGNLLAKIDPATYAVTYHDVGEPVSYISGIVENTDNLYVLSSSSNKLGLFSITGNSISKTLVLSDIPRSFSQVSDGEAGEKRALITNVTSEVDLVDLTNWKIIDQTDRSKIESFASKATFNDLGDNSEPRIINIETVDGIALTERWLLTFNGVIPSTYSQTGSITGSSLNDASGEFTERVNTGDILVINPLEGEKEEILIDGISDNNNLVLDKTPTNTGTVTYLIRTDSSYSVTGSISGPQKARLLEGKTYTTDNGSMSLNIVPSLNHPTTEGDSFTFTTSDGIESIALNGKILPFHMKVIQRESDERELVFIANEGSNDVSVLEILAKKEKSTIK